MKKRSLLAAVLVCALGLSACGNDGTNVSNTDSDVLNITEAEGTDATVESKEPENTQVADEDVPQYDGYELLWHDEFNGTEMDESIWSYDPHEPGWTNAELQEYTTSTDNVFVRDGKLVLKAIKSQTANGRDYYTSGKVKTRDKEDFMYGKVVVSAKIPKGQGLWPAIWMMPSWESTYGNWPKCGEIDIMEVLGNQPNLTYSTIHYGEPHAQQQGTYTLGEGSFADDFHEFSVDWEPAKMCFYVDGNLILTVTDWFTADPGAKEKAFPAPFNQNFYVQLNLAVGGTWPGNPDSTTDFDKAEFEIDYVRVYQKPEYDMNVEKPKQEFREATEDGNLVYNGDFSEEESLNDGEIWSFLLFEGGQATATIADNMLTITPTNAGNVDYSVQLVQPNLPMLQGSKYRVSFDACASADRSMITCISAPDAGWVRYLKDTKVSLTSEWQTYSYEFTMEDKDDKNGRLEFNMGGTGATDEIYIKNVRVEVVE